MKLFLELLEFFKNNNILNVTNFKTESYDAKLKLEKKRKKVTKFGLCPECNNPNTFYDWCQQCNAERFQQDFPNWTSGNKDIDNFIQETQLSAQRPEEVLEWIPYNRLANIKRLDEGGFKAVYKATWLNGKIENWNYDKHEWIRKPNEIYEGYEVAIIEKHDKYNEYINDEFLNEVNIDS